MSKFFAKLKTRWEERRNTFKTKSLPWIEGKPWLGKKTENLEDDEEGEEDKSNITEEEIFKIFWNRPPKKESTYYHKDNIEEPINQTQKELDLWKSEISKIETSTFDEKKGWKPDFLVISGGGMKGFYLPSIIYAIRNRLSNIKAIAGTSIGGLLAGLKLIGGNEEFLLEITEGLDLEWISSQVMITNFTNKGYFTERSWLIDFLSCCIYESFGVPDMTLKEFYDKTKIPFCVDTVCRTDNRLVYLNAFTHPTWSLIEALCATSALPILFPPFIKDGKEYTDGGLVNNYMIELFPPERTLGLYIGKKYPSSHGLIRFKQESFRYFPGIYNALMLLTWCYAMVSFWTEAENFMRVKKEGGKSPREIQIVVNEKVHVASFDLTQEQRVNMMLHGFSIGLYYDTIQWNIWNQEIIEESKSSIQ